MSSKFRIDCLHKGVQSVFTTLECVVDTGATVQYMVHIQYAYSASLLWYEESPAHVIQEAEDVRCKYLNMEICWICVHLGLGNMRINVDRPGRCQKDLGR